jgi:pyridinium-3,5-biscarboxylic acid mononucleotide sulfurtransferase
MGLVEKRAKLQAILRDAGSLLVAYSGGADSAFLAFAAHRELGSKMLAVIADSASLPRRELADALAFTERYGIPTRIVRTEELERSDYRKNDARRCFHCKEELFTRMEEVRAEVGFERIAYGMNVDDRGEFRPGQEAARRRDVLAPLAMAELTKAEIRLLAEEDGLPVWSKPASACLSSRIEYGREISVENLAQVERAEDALHGMGFAQVRVRHHGELARIEIAREDMARALSLGVFQQMADALRGAGFKYVTLDLEGYRSGSMNDVLPVEMLTAGR